MSAKPSDKIQDPYMADLNMTTSVHLNIYNKAIHGLPKSNRYILTRSNWTNFNQEYEDYVSIFGFKAAVQIFTARYGFHLTTEFKDFLSSYLSITQTTVEPHHERLWGENSGANFACYHKADYGAAADDYVKQAPVSQQSLRANMLSLCFKN